MTKFKPGQSGNPSGRPIGALNKATLATQALLDGEAEALTRRWWNWLKVATRWRCAYVWTGSYPLGRRSTP